VRLQAKQKKQRRANCEREDESHHQAPPKYVDVFTGKEQELQGKRESQAGHGTGRRQDYGSNPIALHPSLQLRPAGDYRTSVKLKFRQKTAFC
jgi:hypothetical protein